MINHDSFDLFCFLVFFLVVFFFQMIERHRFLSIFIFISLISRYRCIDSELTVLIPASQRECFHQHFDIDKTIEVEYEVLTGGDFDINYWFYSPTSRVLQSEFKKRDGHHTLKLEETGEYRFCFDNSLSRFHQKQVYFSLRLLNEHDTSTESWMKTIDRDDLGDLQSKVQVFKVSLSLPLFLFLKPRLNRIFHCSGHFSTYLGQYGSSSTLSKCF